MNMSCLQLWPIGPELALGAGALLGVPLAAFTLKRARWLTSVWASLVLLLAMGLAVQALAFPAQQVFCGTYALDPFGSVFKLIILGTALLSLLVIAAYFREHDSAPHAPVLLLFASLGGVGLAGSFDLGLIVLFLQLLSGASYLLVGLARGNRLANEATMKYFVYGAVALGVMAYGLSFLYGLTGSLNLADIGTALVRADPVWVWVALILVLVGYAFEITLVPFHFWAPDVYEGASAPVAGLISVLPKVAGFAGMLRLLLTAFPDGLVGWPTLLAVLAALTMLLGNLAALRQQGLKRLLAYSSIAQAGYLLMAVAAAPTAPGALSATGYYLAAYAFMNIAAFTVAAQLERPAGAGGVTLLRGLGRTAPGTALALTLALLSLAGFPPLAGFAGKVLLFTPALSAGLSWLAVFAAINMVVGLYFYLRPIGEMYLSTSTASPPLHRQPGYLLALWLCTAGTLLLGVWPAPALTLMSRLTALVH